MKHLIVYEASNARGQIVIGHNITQYFRPDPDPNPYVTMDRSIVPGIVSGEGVTSSSFDRSSDERVFH